MAGTTTAALDLPPLLDAVAAPRGGTVLQRAIEGAASHRFEAGTFLHRIGPERVSFALVMEPEVEASRAAAMLMLAQVAIADAVAAIAPPETTLALRWSGDVLLNGAVAATLDGAMAACRDDEVPDWLAVGAIMRLADEREGGTDPGRTTLRAELGHAAEPTALLEAIARHWMLWLHRWESEGLAPIARQWSSRAVDAGQEVEAGGSHGRFAGLDDDGGAVLTAEGDAHVLPALSLWRRESTGP